MAILLRRATRPRVRGVLLGLAVGLLLAISACGFNSSTLQTYTPSAGINFSTGGDNPVDVRNLVIVSTGTGHGYIMGTLTAANQDALVGVSGTPIKPDGSAGAPLQVTFPGRIPVGNNVVVNLVNAPEISASSADLAAGLTADVSLKFTNAGVASAVVPVMPGDVPPYSTATPAPAPPSGNATP